MAQSGHRLLHLQMSAFGGKGVTDCPGGNVRYRTQEPRRRGCDGTILPFTAVRMQDCHFTATNGAHDSNHATNAVAVIEQRGRGRRVDDLVIVCTVAADHTGAGATGAGGRKRQCLLVAETDH